MNHRNGVSWHPLSYVGDSGAFLCIPMKIGVKSEHWRVWAPLRAMLPELRSLPRRAALAKDADTDLLAPQVCAAVHEALDRQPGGSARHLRGAQGRILRTPPRFGHR
jgi:hypothetical protein